MTSTTDVAFAGMRISKVVGINVPDDEAPGNEPFVCIVLEEVSGTRKLPIAVGMTEGFDLAAALQGRTFGRPMTPDFAVGLVRALGGEVRQVRIDRVIDEVYTATVEITGPAGTSLVDARPSDALNLAARLNAPVAAASGVLADAAERCEGDMEQAVLLRRALALPGMVIGGRQA